MGSNNQLGTSEQIQRSITAARDSVGVVNEVLAKLAAGDQPTNQVKGNLERNVGHLKIITSSQEVIDSGQNIEDLKEAIVIGEAKLAESIWPPVESNPLE